MNAKVQTMWLYSQKSNNIATITSTINKLFSLDSIRSILLKEETYDCIYVFYINDILRLQYSLFRRGFENSSEIL